MISLKMWHFHFQMKQFLGKDRETSSELSCYKGFQVNPNLNISVRELEIKLQEISGRKIGNTSRTGFKIKFKFIRQ